MTERQVIILTGAAVLAGTVALVWKHKQRKTSTAQAEVSSRGQLLTLPALPYMDGVIQGFVDPYDRHENSGGVILLAVAENKLCWDILEPRIRQGFALVPRWAMSYGPMHGQSMLREPLAAFMGKHIYKGAVIVDPEHLVVGVGLSAILSSLFYCICEAGDSVLIPAPYYSAFDNDLRAFGGVERVPVYSEGGLGLALSPSDLEKAYASVVANTGKPPKVLLLTNPHNPLGRVLKRSELMAIADWCDSKPGLHLVSDEIYALSEFADELTAIAQGTTTTSNSNSGGGNEGFVSLGAISASADAAVPARAAGAGAAGTAGAPGAKFGPFRHVLWGLSKDLGVSGFRVGVLWSQNETLLGAMQSAAVFTSVPGPVQSMVGDMLGDDTFMAHYISENRRRLASRCFSVTARLEALGLPVLPATAGMYVWIDFRSLLPLIQQQHGSASDASDSGWAAEAMLYEALLAKPFRVCLTPGQSQHAKEPGFFRMCYAYVPDSGFEDALAKIEAFVTSLRNTRS